MSYYFARLASATPRYQPADDYRVTVDICAVAIALAPHGERAGLAQASHNARYADLLHADTITIKCATLRAAAD